MRKIVLVAIVGASLFFAGCTKETQNEIGRSLQNWTGSDGVLDIYMGGKLVKRFINIAKLTSATSTKGNDTRDYRYGYGYLDTNRNFRVDEGERKLYFEISNYSTPYIFYENPKY